VFSRVFIVNIFLLALVVFLGVKTHDVWGPTKETAGEIRRVSKPSSRKHKRFNPKKMPPESAFNSVVEKNLFTPKRKTAAAEEPGSEPEPEIVELPELGKRFIVYGIVIADGHERALVKNPGRKRGDRKDVWVQVGDSVGEFEIAAIMKDRVIVTEGANRYEALLYDEDTPKKREAVEKSTQPAVIVTEPKKSSQKTQKKAEEGKYRVINTPFGKIKKKVK
jgi:hypothetical protein